MHSISVLLAVVGPLAGSVLAIFTAINWCSTLLTFLNRGNSPQLFFRDVPSFHHYFPQHCDCCCLAIINTHLVFFEDWNIHMLPQVAGTGEAVAGEEANNEEARSQVAK